MSEKIKVLYLDDEPNNLIGFKASFRFDYQIFIANTIEEAKTHLNQHPDIRIIFCDQRMPKKTGVEFFEEIRTEHPLPIRILLTAYSDVNDIIDSINIGHIFRYVKKPWVEADIISAIDEANKFYTANSMLSIKNEELSKAYKELDKFAYSVSHDLRGPLVGIAGGISLALQLNDIDEIKKILKMMERSVVKLDEFILNMHDYYSIERGELKITDIDFLQLEKELKDVYEVYSKTSGIQYTSEVSQDSPFRSDLSAIKLILNNLISNGFKYQKEESDNKSVHLNIKVFRGNATIKVSDTGLGIAQKFKEEIFNLFFRAHAVAQGSGFGLFNVKSAVIKLNGTINLDSEPNIGSTFTITIPDK